MKKNAIVILVTLIFLFSSAWAGNIDSSADAERPDKIIDVEYPEILDFGDQIFGPIDIDSETLDNQNLGVEFDGEYFWVTGGNTAMDPNKLYKLDRDFSLVEAYDQPSHSTSWGWRDMTWDGTYLYASVDGNLDQIDPSTGEWTGETVNGPENPNRALAYDPATDHFWTANFSSAIYEFDRDGDIINSFGNSYSVYGMAWDDVSSDGPWLWVFDQTNNVSSIAWQFDPVAGEYTGVSIDMTEVTNDIAGGLAFSDEYDPTLGILIGLIQGQGSGFDYLSGYEVAETGGGGEELVYMENFDSGMGDWSGEWGLATSNYHSPPNSLADSPTGNYADYDTVVVEMMTDIDLTNFVGARLEFWTKYDIELGFDYIYLEISADGGMNWNPLETFNGEGVDWTLYNADIGGYAGGSVRFKLTLESDAGYNTDGMYVDDFAVYGTDIDNSPPLILHDAPDEATSAQYDYIAVATISDPSDVQSASLSYSIEGSDLEIVEPDSTVGDDYYFTIPEQDGGTPIMYFFTAEDGEGNTGDSPEYNYVAGTVLYYDDGEAEYIYSYAPGNKLAVRFTPSEPAILVSGLIRLYTDPSNELDTVDVEAWERSGNNPGESLIEPFAVWPTSTLGDPEAFTYADFRGMNVTVDDDFFFGFTYRSGWPVILGDSPGVSGRSRHHNGSSWGDPASDVDYHIRAIVDYDIVGVEDDGEVVPSEYSLKQNYPNPFNAKTTIGYSLRSRTPVKLEVFNLLGQNVATLVDKNQNAGFYSVSWNATDLSSGVYFYKLTAGDNAFTKRMTMIK